MPDKEDGRNDAQKLWEKIKDVRIAMLTTREPDGMLRSRPMATQQTESDGELWFFTYDDSAKVEEIEKHRDVNVSYAAHDKSLYVSVSGKAQLTRDRAKAEELWNPFLKAWFPDGLEDPKLVLVKVAVEQAEFWDTPDNKVVQLVGFAKALVTGKPIDPGENKRIDFTGDSPVSVDVTKLDG
jgi:general stress protein 26